MGDKFSIMSITMVLHLSVMYLRGFFGRRVHRTSYVLLSHNIYVYLSRHAEDLPKVLLALEREVALCVDNQKVTCTAL